MTDYYNERNGWVDNGKPLNPKNTKCPNCKGNNYVETVSREYCRDCGLECDYWGGGANDVYESMMERTWAAEKRKREEEEEQYYRDMYGDDTDDENW